MQTRVKASSHLASTCHLHAFALYAQTLALMASVPSHTLVHDCTQSSPCNQKHQDFSLLQEVAEVLVSFYPGFVPKLTSGKLLLNIQRDSLPLV